MKPEQVNIFEPNLCSDECCEVYILASPHVEFPTKRSASSVVLLTIEVELLRLSPRAKSRQAQKKLTTAVKLALRTSGSGPAK